MKLVAERTNKKLTNHRKKMKCNQWTLGLAAVGLVSLTSIARADSTNAVLTALNSTTISGFVDTSAVWNLGTHNSADPAPGFAGANGHDGFNLDVVDLNLQKSADATDGWGAGYDVELWFGPGANSLGTGTIAATSTSTRTGGGTLPIPITTTTTASGGDLAVKNAYVELKTPVGNGIDWKIGVWDTIIGYEVADSVNNPNFTRSYGFGVEPTTHTGVLGSYTINDMFSVAAGVADTYGPVINARANPPEAESYKSYMGDVSFTAPKALGFLAGSTLYACVINGFNSADGSQGGDQTSFYAGATINTPLSALKVGASYDYVAVGKQTEVGIGKSGYVYVLGGFATYQLTEKISLNARGEYGSETADAETTFLPSTKVLEGTLDVQYDLWKNVLSRVEFRWDHDSGDSGAFGGGASGNPRDNAFAVIGNVAYKF
jgi:hypothetical protein